MVDPCVYVVLGPESNSQEIDGWMVVVVRRTPGITLHKPSESPMFSPV